MDEDSIAVEIRYMREDIKEMKQDIKDLKTKPCPQPLCTDHETRIQLLETNEGNKVRSEDLKWVKIGILSSALLGLLAILVSIIL